MLHLVTLLLLTCGIRIPSHKMHSQNTYRCQFSTATHFLVRIDPPIGDVTFRLAKGRQLIRIQIYVKLKQGRRIEQVTRIEHLNTVIQLT